MKYILLLTTSFFVFSSITEASEKRGREDEQIVDQAIKKAKEEMDFAGSDVESENEKTEKIPAAVTKKRDTRDHNGNPEGSDVEDEPVARKKANVQDGLSWPTLYQMIQENPHQIRESKDLQTQLVNCYYEFGGEYIKLISAKLFELLPTLAEDALTHPKCAYVYIRSLQIANKAIPQNIVDHTIHLANQGDAIAQNVYGVMLDHGWIREDGTTQAPSGQEAIEWWTAAGQRGDMLGKCNLALTYGRQKSNQEKEFALYSEAAAAGCVRGYYHLGLLHAYGWVKSDGSQQVPDFEQAAQWFTLAAKHGFARAHLELGKMFEKGWQKNDGSQQAPDVDQAIELYTLVANHEEKGAQTKLAVLYAKGWNKKDGTRQDPIPDKEVQWLTVLAQKGIPEAQNNLANKFFSGWVKSDGTQQAPDVDKAIEWSIASARQGNVKAQLCLAFLYSTGWKKSDGTQQAPNFEQAAKWWTAAAQQGDALAQNNLGAMYLKGWPMSVGLPQPRNIEKAIEWLTAAAKQGFVVAQANLADKYQHGWIKSDGSQQAPNPDKAVEWYIAAAQKGHVPSRLRIPQLLTIAPTPNQAGANNVVRVLCDESSEKLEHIICSDFCYWAERSNPNPSMTYSDSHADEFIFGMCNKIQQNLSRFKHLLQTFEQPGFLVTSCKPVFDVFATSPEERFASQFIFDRKSYYCFGNGFEQTAEELRALLEALQTNAELKALKKHLKWRMKYIDDEDLESKQNGEAVVTRLTEVKTELRAMSDEVLKNIHTKTPSRNRKFEESIGVVAPEAQG